LAVGAPTALLFTGIGKLRPARSRLFQVKYDTLAECQGRTEQAHKPDQ